MEASEEVRTHLFITTCWLIIPAATPVSTTITSASSKALSIITTTSYTTGRTIQLTEEKAAPGLVRGK